MPASTTAACRRMNGTTTTVKSSAPAREMRGWNTVETTTAAEMGLRSRSKRVEARLRVVSRRAGVKYRRTRMKDTRRMITFRRGV